MVKVVSNPKDITDSLNDFSEFVKTFEDRAEEPTMMELNGLESESRCLRERILQEFRVETGLTFESAVHSLCSGPLMNKGVIENYVLLNQYLVTLNSIDIRIRDLVISF